MRFGQAAAVTLRREEPSVECLVTCLQQTGASPIAVQGVTKRKKKIIIRKIFQLQPSLAACRKAVCNYGHKTNLKTGLFTCHYIQWSVIHCPARSMHQIGTNGSVVNVKI